MDNFGFAPFWKRHTIIPIMPGAFRRLVMTLNLSPSAPLQLSPPPPLFFSEGLCNLSRHVWPSVLSSDKQWGGSTWNGYEPAVYRKIIRTRWDLFDSECRLLWRWLRGSRRSTVAKPIFQGLFPEKIVVWRKKVFLARLPTSKVVQSALRNGGFGFGLRTVPTN